MNDTLRGRCQRFAIVLGLIAAAGACSSPTPNAGGEADGADPAGSTAGNVATGGPSPAVATASGTNVELQLATAHLAVVIDEGSACAEPTCVEVLELGLDGGWAFTGTDGTTSAGSFDAAPLAGLVATADPATIVSGPFLGECPTVRNGTERTYLVFDPEAVATNVLTVGSCHDQIDASAPLIEALDLLAAEARS